MTRRHRLLLGSILAAGVAVALAIVMGQRPELVVYCAHDSVYADAIIRDFAETSGIRVAVKYDTEATKSLGLTELLVHEKARPRCDVFWNNELLGTLDLKAKGVLAPYRGTGYQRIPDGHKDPDGMWTGFAARMRVYIVNTNLCEASVVAVATRLSAQDLSRVAMARPLYGTTLTHYCALWQQLGETELKIWHRSLRARGMQELAGNSTVKNRVAAGGCDLGFTDTDDFFLARDAGAPVALLPVRLPDGKTIVIPNTVGMIANCANPEHAQRFIDHLLSARTELALANSASRQIPLGVVDHALLNSEVRALADAAAEAGSLAGLSDIRTACVGGLKQQGTGR